MTTSPVVSGRSLAYCAALIPLAVWAVIAALCGRAEAAAQRWGWFRTRMLNVPPPRATHRPGILAIAGHAVLSVLLGAAALVPLGIEYLFVARGVFYGLTDAGPYDHSWGGPTRGGAWLVHFLITVPLAGAGILVLAGIAAVHQRLTVGLTGRRPGPWPIVATVLLAAGAVAFFIAWLHQL